MATRISQLPVMSETNSKSHEDWRLWCRLCAKGDAQHINVLLKYKQLSDGINDTSCATFGNSLNIAAAIEKHFWTNITCEDELPKMLCSECYSLILSLITFSEHVHKVQQLYRYLQTANISNTLDCHALRLRFGLIDTEHEVEENMDETETESGVETIFTNPPKKQPLLKKNTSGKKRVPGECPQDENAKSQFNRNDGTDIENEEVESTESMQNKCGVKCCVKSCRKSRRKIEGLRIFKFPPCQTVMGQIWREQCNISPEDHSKALYICGNHFAKADFGKKYLRSGSFPFLHLDAGKSIEQGFNAKKHSTISEYKPCKRCEKYAKSVEMHKRKLLQCFKQKIQNKKA